MNINNPQELKEAVKRQEPELIIVAPNLIRQVRLLIRLRFAANVTVFVILAVAIFMWANPFRIPFFDESDGRLVRQILLGVGILLLFADYLMPIARYYKIVRAEEGRLLLMLRKSK
ncbi:MAG: hypothetical protein ACUVUD_06925 [bacterium]